MTIIGPGGLSPKIPGLDAPLSIGTAESAETVVPNDAPVVPTAGSEQDEEPGFEPTQQRAGFGQRIRDWWNNFWASGRARNELDEMVGITYFNDLYHNTEHYDKIYWQLPIEDIDQQPIIDNLRNNSGLNNWHP